MGDKTLIIAEKPSVAADLVKVLPGKFKRTRSYFESNDTIISYAIGHLVSICYPEEIDERYKKWQMDLLPILPDTFPLKGLPSTRSQLNSLQKLIRRRDVTRVINACDAGREGELIFQYIVNYVWNSSVAKKEFKRLWLQSMTRDAIRDGFAHLRDHQEMKPLEDTALCRSESDWLIGINATRALTSYNSRKGGFFLTPCGRVQTPTLSMLVKREKARMNFVPTPFVTLTGTFTYEQESYEGKWIDPDFVKDKTNEHAKADRIWEPKKAERIVAKCKGLPARVEETTKKTSQSSPQLYDLTSLQREANSRFGFSAKNTLALAQVLYERHKALTYPRTDSRYLPEDYPGIVRKTLKNLTGYQYGEFARVILDKKYVKANKRIFNNSKVSDHHAIIPTTRLPKNLSEPELKIYTMVLQRFLAVFFPPARYLQTKRLSVVQEESFLTTGKILIDPGWKIIYGHSDTEKDGTVLKPVPDKAEVLCSDILKEEKETKAPPRFNESTLLSSMEHSGKLVDDEELAEAMKERGLGTPATRAAIIEKLLKEKYVVREGKELTPTGKAFELLALLAAMKIDVLASPEMTGEWEHKLNKILKGTFTREQFMKEIRELTNRIISQVKNFQANGSRTECDFSPINNIRYFSTPTAYVSEDESIAVRKVLGGRVMAEPEIIDLLSGKTIGPFSDFRSKKGKNFTATVKLTNNKVEFLFANDMDSLDKEQIKRTESLGLSPVDQTPVFETPMAYLSESALNNDEKKGLRISRTILSKEITADNIRQLLTKGKTELIEGFISKKRRPFDAYLLLDNKGKISFEFPPRKSKRKRGQKKS